MGGRRSEWPEPLGKFWPTGWGHSMWLEWGPLEERVGGESREAERLGVGISPWLHRFGGPCSQGKVG